MRSGSVQTTRSEHSHLRGTAREQNPSAFQSTYPLGSHHLASRSNLRQNSLAVFPSMPAMAPALTSNQLVHGPVLSKTLEPESFASSFTKPRPRLSPNQRKDAASSSSASTAPTSSAGSSQDSRSECSNDLHWDALSTSSGSDHEMENWGSRSPISLRRHNEKERKPHTVWREPCDSSTSHKMKQEAPTTALTGTTSWQSPPPMIVKSSIDNISPRRSLMPEHHIASPTMVPSYRETSSMRRPMPFSLHHPTDKKLAVGSPLHLTPVPLTSVTSSSASPVFAPRLRPVVHPINIGPPSEYDFRNTNGLMKCLNSLAPPPSPEELSAKHLVINELQRIVDAWMKIQFPHEESATATLLLGGSWHLKVGMSDSDLDIAVLLPKFVTSEMFFSSLHGYLQSIDSVSKLISMNKAAVPILAFQLNQVRIDLLFARFTQNVVPKNLPIHSDQILAGMDAASIRSLSVPRIASLILELVPNDAAFRSCLRIIRLWAKQRRIYSNKAGFLGGVSWTILVAFVCQMFPKATISSMIHHFFSIMSTWHWPTPILLSKPYECAGIPPNLQWSPEKNHHDRAHVMPIITPGFPAVNSAVNVNTSTLRILKVEFERGKSIMDDMFNKGLSSPAVWQKLFAPSEFLVRYDHYLVIEMKASTEDELTEWSNYIASRTRKLVETLQHTAPLQDVHPYPELVQSESMQLNSAGYYFIGYSLKPGRRPYGGGSSLQSKLENTMKQNVASAVRYFVGTEIDKCSERKDGMSVDITHRRWQELPEAIFPHGRAAAAGERARFILSRAHTHHVALGLGR